jgi:hypothetical protein
MKNLLVSIFLIVLTSTALGGEIFDLNRFLEGGAIRYEENRIFKVSTSGGKKYSGPLFCSDHILSGRNVGYKEDECLIEGNSAEYWFDLQTGEFVNGRQLNFEKSKIDGLRKFSTRIEFFNSVAVISFDGVVANGYMQTAFLTGNFLADGWTPFPHHCSSDRLLVADIIENNKEMFKLSDSESRNRDLIDAIGDSDFPYFLKYIDDDEVWGAGRAASNSGESIYIFVGDKTVKVISEVIFGLCSPDGSFVKSLKEDINIGAKLQYRLIRN